MKVLVAVNWALKKTDIWEFKSRQEAEDFIKEIDQKFPSAQWAISEEVEDV